MHESIYIGEINTLTINRATDNGLYLIAEDEEEVLLPNAYVKDEMLLGDSIDVFVYTDSEDRIISTTLKPKAMVEEFAFLKVVDKSDFGAFLDWGLPKDLFVPLREQKNLKVGESYLFRVGFDQKTKRLYASQKIGKFLDTKPTNLEKNQEVQTLIFAKTPLGYKALINKSYEGMIYKNEIFEDINIGDEKKAYIKAVRADGKVDLSLQPIGKEAKDGASTKIVELLEKNGGSLKYNYKSNPDDIKTTFGLSKKAYKKALTSLIDSKKITIDDEGMKLIL